MFPGFSAENHGVVCAVSPLISILVKKGLDPMRSEVIRTLCLVGLVSLMSADNQLWAATPTVEQALRLAPLQKDVDFDRPDEKETSKCSIQAERTKGITGWVVRNSAGQLLRRFADTNGDNKVDTWCYFKGGIEVYRDIDADFNGKADQYRFLGTAGTRWGLDSNEDGKIDQWKVISAEEATAEVVAALRDADAGRFRRLLLTPTELKSLGLGEEKAKEIGRKIAAAASPFSEAAAKKKSVGQNARWVHFGGLRPGVIPAGTDGASKDVTVYENVVAVVETGGKHVQVHVGTLIQVGRVWRVIDRPTELGGEQTAGGGGFFFRTPTPQRPVVDQPVPTGLSQDARKLLAELEDLDAALAKASSPTDRAKLNQRRVDVLKKLVTGAAKQEERTVWVRQLADTVSAAVQAGEYPEGIKQLEALYASLKSDSSSTDLAAYVKFLSLMAVHSRRLQAPNAKFPEIQEQWLKELEAFVKAYPKAGEAAEAMLQLALAKEFAGEDKSAKQWYARIVSDFPALPVAKKAAGARRRLESVGKPLSLQGRTTDGRSVDLASLRGKVVLIHYWATWCELCKQEFTTLRALQAKYGADGFTLVGVNLDSDPKKLAAYLRQNRLAWPQLYEAGGMDSRLATELGILTLPTMILVDAQGKVIHRNIHVSQLDEELKKRLR